MPSNRRRRTLRTDAQQLAEQLDWMPSGTIIVDEHGHAWQSVTAGDVTYWYRAYDDIEPQSSFHLAQQTSTVAVAKPVRRP